MLSQAPPLDPVDLNIRHLAAVSEIVRQKTMSATAAAIGITQPALTQGLNKLEAQLGVRLFDRQPAGMRATPEGAALIARVDSARAHLRAGLDDAPRPELLITASQLRALLGLADHGGFAEAARALSLAEGTLHRAIATLERNLARPLVLRRGRGVALTTEGQRLARAARLAMREIGAAIAELEGATPSLTIGAMPLCRAQLLPRALHSLLARWPDVHVRIVEGSWNELIEPLRDGVLDLMIGALRDDPAPPDLRQHPLFEDKLVVVAGPHHPLRGGEPSLDQLAAYGWIVGPPASPLRRHWEGLFSSRALPPAPIECGSVMTIRELLRASDLLTLLSPAQVSVEVAGGALALVGSPLKDCVRTIGVAMRAGWRPTPVQDALLDALARASSEMRL